MELKNLIMFSVTQSGIQRDLIYKRMYQAAEMGQLINFTYNDTGLTDEDKIWLRKQMLTLFEKYDII